MLVGRHVRLEPTLPADAAPLYAALDDAEVWRWLGSARPTSEAGMAAVVGHALTERDAGRQWPWTVRLADATAGGTAGGTSGGTAVGWSSYLDIEPAHERIEIGSTAYGRRWWRSAVNTECKLLLLGHAFDELGYGRVSLKTDGRNERSQAAIARLGAVREGVLRRHVRRPDGSFRDTVYFSVLAEEWPRVRARLERLLEAALGAGDRDPGPL